MQELLVVPVTQGTETGSYYLFQTGMQNHLQVEAQFLPERYMKDATSKDATTTPGWIIY